MLFVVGFIKCQIILIGDRPIGIKHSTLNIQRPKGVRMDIQRPKEVCLDEWIFIISTFSLVYCLLSVAY